jgi:glyoxylase-like metal-dependent hydrolase (beta-lactamase superfamily II)
MTTLMLPPPLAIGEFRVTQIAELEQPFLPLAQMFPAARPNEIADMLPRLEPWCVDAQGRVLLVVQTWLVETGRHRILVDTCIGCGKTNRRFAEWHGRTDTAWLRRLAAAGIAPDAVTHVLCTHLHSDHAGWNTRLLDGRWVPTFPHARYIFARTEVEHCQRAEADIWAESVSPVVAAGQAVLVETDHQIEDGIWLEPTPGHTPGHVAVHLESRGEHAVLWGDLLHSPAQCFRPDWAYARDTSPGDSIASRSRVLAACAEHRWLILPAHFPLPSAGHVEPDGAGWRFRYADRG